MIGNKLVKIFLGVAVALFIITFAIAVPILWRDFYFLNVKWLDIEKESGYTETQIRDAYNEVMDFLVLGEDFGTGELPYSEDGKSHFEDVRALFVLDFVVLGVSALYIIAVYVLAKLKVIQLQYANRSPEVWSLIGLGAFFVVVGIWAVIDFSSLFEVFHHVAFPGKTNWYFSAYTDAIITILPEKLWFNFVVLVAGVFVAFVVAILLTEKIRKRKFAPTENQQ